LPTTRRILPLVSVIVMGIIIGIVLIDDVVVVVVAILWS
jgi:hypothetical protein